MFKKIATPSLLTVIMVLYAISCTTTPSQRSYPTNDSITHESFYNITSKTTYHIVTINLKDPAISVITNNAVENGYTKGQSIRRFAQKNKTEVAINASPFSYPKTYLSPVRKIEGLFINEGKELSKPLEQYAALCFTKENKAFIVDKQTDQNISNAWIAVGGFWTILENDTIYQFKDIKEARTAIGISEDGYKLYILTVEKNKHSNGLNFMECASILQEKGAHKALQLDGGSSTNLIVQNTNNISVISQRKLANCLGFRIN